MATHVTGLHSLDRDPETKQRKFTLVAGAFFAGTLVHDWKATIVDLSQPK